MLNLLGFMGLGTTELLIFGLIVLLLFGNRLPGVMRSMGRGIVEFKKGVSGVDDEDENPKEVTEKKPERVDSGQDTAQAESAEKAETAAKA